MSEEVGDEDRRVLQEMIGRFDAPSFIRRARLVETTWHQLFARCAHARLERLVFVRLRLGQLLARFGSWEAVGQWLPDDGALEQLRRLHEELQPRLRLLLDATESDRIRSGALTELAESMEMFNQRWARWLPTLDMRPVNKARADYNRYYLFEKECAVGSVRVARLNFQQFDPLTHADVARHFPLLIVPRFARP